jgi:hypothetical protein
MAERVVLLSIANLQLRDVTPGALTSLERLARRGSLLELTPAAPGLAASAFTTVITGTPTRQHGIIGNLYFDRDPRRVRVAPLPDSVIQVPRLWEQVRERRPGACTMLWFPPNCLDADVEFGAWIDPQGTLVTRPGELAAELTARFGLFPKRDGPGEPPRLAATRWMLQTASALLSERSPDLAILRVPYLGQIARRYGPDGREAGRAVRELEPILAPLLAGLAPGTAVLAATESIVTPVAEPARPNLVLREMGMLHLQRTTDGGLTLDLDQSQAFALTDHQICHIYLNNPHQAAPIAAAFAGEHGDGVARVLTQGQRAKFGLDHPRSGDLILLADPDAWFAPDWWTRPAEEPRRDPSGLIRPALLGPLDPSQVQGSQGAPIPGPEYLGVLATSEPIAPERPILATELASLILRHWP